MTRVPTRLSRWGLLALVAAIAASNGCAALSNPISDGIPVRMLPKEVLGRPRSDQISIPLTLLRLPEQKNYKLDKDDMLAVIAGDLFGPDNIAPPVTPAEPQSGTLASVGYPVPVRDDGTISLPNAKIPPIYVKGMTTIEVEALLREILTGKSKDPKYQGLNFFKEGGAKISVQLQKKRRYKVTVVRDDTQGIPASNAGSLTSVQKRVGTIVTLEAGQNDVLTALNYTGGPPGLDGKDEVLIYRGTFDPKDQNKGISRVPLRIYPDQELKISEADITLGEGDIVKIPGRDAEVFYVAGILNTRQFGLPREYDLNVLEAITIANGPLINGAFQTNAFQGSSVQSGLGQPSPALVNVIRKLPDGQQINIRVDVARALKDPRERIYIQTGDLIVMQEKPGEAIGRYLTQTFRFNLTQQFFHTSTGLLNTTATGP